MPIVCSCGNTLPGKVSFKVNSSPCRCEEKGPLKRMRSIDVPVPDFVTEQVYNERKRVGLDVATPLERGLEKAKR